VSPPLPRPEPPRPAAALIGTLALIGGALAYLGLYANAATLDVAYADYLLPPFITAVDACMSRQDCFGALLAPTSNGYRWTVPALLLSVNAMVFGLNTRFEMLLGFVGLALASLTLYLWLSTTWLRSARPAVAVVAWLPCLFFLFNLNQWENIVLGIGGYHLLGLAALIPCLWAIDHALRSPRIAGRQAWILLLALVGSSLFLLQYFVVLAVAAVMLAAIAFATGHRSALGVVATVLAGAAVGLFVTFVPAASFGQSPSALPGPGDLAAVGRFFLNMLAAAMLQWEGKRVLADSGYVLGLPAMIAFAMAIWLFFAQRMYRTSWLPLALCIYSLLACAVISFSRFRYGADYGFASRYTSQTILGFLGCYLVLVKALESRTNERGAIGLVAAFCLTVATLQLATHVVQWQIAPHRQAYYREVTRVAATFEQAPEAELARLQVPAPAARQALPILRRHRLAFFR
jgi:hypothetical protein